MAPMFLVAILTTDGACFLEEEDMDEEEDDRGRATSGFVSSKQSF